MKTRKNILMFAIATMLIGVPSLPAAKNKQKTKERMKETVKKEITSGNYKIEVNTAIPMRGGNIILSSRYSLEIKNDSVFSYLPYYGRAYSIPYGGGNGLDFQAPIKEYKMKVDKKGTAHIKLATRSPEDLFEYHIKIFNNGSTTINVSMQNRESINFIGDLVIEKEKN